MSNLKEKHAIALLTVENLAAVVHMASVCSDDEEESEDDVRWVEDDDEEESDMYFIAVEDATSLEGSLSNTAFLHCRSYESDMASALAVMKSQLGDGYNIGTRFDGKRLDTTSNRRS